MNEKELNNILIKCLGDSASIDLWKILAKAWLETEKDGLCRRTVSAYQKAILESEYDRLLMELI